MTTQEQQESTTTCSDGETSGGPSGGADAVYGMGMIGAWVYYFKRATTTEERVKAFFKGLVWPAFVVYDLMGVLEDKQPTQDQ